LGRGREGAIKNRNETPLPRMPPSGIRFGAPWATEQCRKNAHPRAPASVARWRTWFGRPCLGMLAGADAMVASTTGAATCNGLQALGARAPMLAVASCLGAGACARVACNQGCALGGGTGAKCSRGGIELAPACAWCMCCHPRRPWCVLRAWRLLSRLGKFFVTAQTYLMSDGWTGANSLRTTIGGRRVDPPAVVGDMGIFEPGPPPSKPRALRWNGHRNEGLRAFESN